MTTTSSTTGASWLLTQPDPESTFTPEQLSEEHRLMAQTVEEFMTTEVLPQVDQLETKDWALLRRLVGRADGRARDESGQVLLLLARRPEEHERDDAEVGVRAVGGGE